MTGVSQLLAGSYSDETVEAIATEDGAAQLYTAVWGKGNAAPRPIDAINRGAEVSSSMVSHELQRSLVPIETGLEQLAAEYPHTEHEVVAAVDAVEVAEIASERVAEVCLAEGVGLPVHSWSQRFSEVAAFGLLGVGDLYLSTKTFEVFGLSDRPMGFLPMNELQIAAMSTVVALLILAYVTGHLIRDVGHLMETCRTGLDKPAKRRVSVRQWFTTAAAMAALSGALGILLGLSQVRASYLAQSGIDAHPSQFFLIQVGIASAGVVVSFWNAHPYDKVFRSSSTYLAEATAGLAMSYSSFAGLLGEYNGLLRERAAVLSQHSDWSEATVTDATRNGAMYARRVLLAQPETTTDPLLPATLPTPATPALIAAVAQHHMGKSSVFKVYEPLSLAKVDARLSELDQHRAERARGTAPTPSRSPSSSKSPQSAATPKVPPPVRARPK